ASVAAAAVAAHECGHAVQHATAYSMLQLRSKIVPAVQISSKLSQWILFAGIIMLGVGNGNATVLLVGIVLFAVTTLFTVITLLVEVDASKSALSLLIRSGSAHDKEQEQATDALK